MKIASEILDLYRKSRLPHALLLSAQDTGFLLSEVLDFLNIAFSLDLKTEKLKSAATHPDILFLWPDEKSEIFSVSDIRKVVAFSLQTPMSLPQKFTVILDAEKMNPQASNALLKTLEAPPSHSFFLLLTSNPSKLIPTVLSRCQHFSAQHTPTSTLREVPLPEFKSPLMKHHFSGNRVRPPYLSEEIQVETADALISALDENEHKTPQILGKLVANEKWFIAVLETTLHVWIKNSLLKDPPDYSFDKINLTLNKVYDTLRSGRVLNYNMKNVAYALVFLLKNAFKK